MMFRKINVGLYGIYVKCHSIVNTQSGFGRNARNNQPFPLSIQVPLRADRSRCNIDSEQAGTAEV